MNGDEVSKRMDHLQASVRTARAEVTALHTRISLLEYRLNQIDLRIGELPIGIEDMKSNMDIRFDTVEVLIRDLMASLIPQAPPVERGDQ